MPETRSPTTAVVSIDPLGYITHWSAAACTLFGHTPAEALGQHILMLRPDEPGLAELEALGRPGGLTVTRHNRAGLPLTLQLTVTADQDPHQRVTTLHAHYAPVLPTLSDSERHRLYRRIIEDSSQGVLVTDAQERIVMVNTAFTRITGYTAAEALGQTPDLLRSGRHDAAFRAQVRGAMQGTGLWLGEIMGRRKNGEVFPQSVSISTIRNDQGEVTHAFSIFSDITEHKQTEAQLQRLSHYDTATGLPNRTLFNELLGTSLGQARRQHTNAAVLVVQLQRLSGVYDSLGHEAGDLYVQHMALRLRATLRETDTLARLGHDKFAICLPAVPVQEHAALVAQKLLNALRPAHRVTGHEVPGDASTGIALYPLNGTDAATLLRCAELANAKAHSDNDSDGTLLFFSDEMNARATERFRIESGLRQALAQGGLELHYQPKVSLRSGRIVGAEALVRWQHPQQGFIPPGQFIPVAEETSLILELGDWLLNEACRQMRAWQDQGLHMPPIAINLSARQFTPQLPGQIEGLLQTHGLQARQLKLEITETLVVRGPDEVVPTMNELVAMGLDIALDDFGTGYSSLAYLKRFPIQTLKIDRAFVEGIPLDANDCAIAQAIVTMGQQLRQEIVAEGVETHEQMVFLKNLGCDQLQGYLFSKPVPASAFEQMVREDKRLSLS
ncbi:MAG: hypothetical protein RJA09_2499 [Pseudomonadota bacterium]